MRKRDRVSLSVIKRLPRYYRFLDDLLQQGATRISSRELAEMMQLTASQIRQDLNCFGGFGQQGYGYNVEVLRQEIANILGLNRHTKTVLIGAGNLGRTIGRHMDFESSGFSLIGVFDSDPEVVGRSLRNIQIQHMDELETFCKEHNPQAAVLCLPQQAAAEVASTAISYGIKNFWNFSHYDLALTFSDITVENVHLGDSLMTLSYQIHAGQAQDDA